MEAVRPTTSIQQRLQHLKHDLKKFENAFRARHGRVAAREEIKADATIWGKYREYKDLQRRSSKPARKDEQEASVQEHETRPLKERPANSVSATPQKRSKASEKLQVLDLPPQEIEATPACIRQALGPTPQRDGAVLGIFDMLPSDTPSKERTAPSSAVANKVEATPSKPSATSSDPVLSRTPQSSGKRFFLTAYAGTPLKRKAEDDLRTPSTVKRQFATPSFLRRNHTLPPIHEDGHETLPTQPFRKRQGLVRSLSTIIQGLKKQEEERMDDDWDILREIEAEEEGEPGMKSGLVAKSNAPTVLVEESQEMPLGPDQGAESSEDDGAGDRGAVDANGNPRKVWKKKGLKRQTKRTKMRPVIHKPQKAVDVDEDEDDSQGGDDGDEEVGGERHDSQLSTHESSRPSAKRKAKAQDEGEKAGKKSKKVGPQDHANFRRLNIKNKNSKAKGKGGRFGRR